LSDKKVDLMMKNGYFQLSVDRFSYLKEHFPEKHINLLKRNALKFIETLSEYSLDKNDILSLLDSVEFNSQQKMLLIQSIENDLIIGDIELINAICNILATQPYIELDFDLLKSLLQYARSMDNRLRLFILQIHQLSSEQITELLNVLGEPYSDIAINGKRPSLPKNQLNFDFVNKLQEKDYISTYKEKEDKIKVNTKQS
jgi:hypothetical protein